MTSQSTTHTSSTSANRAGVGKDHDRRMRSDADPPGGNAMVVGTVEDLGLVAGAVRVDFSLCIRRDARSGGGTVSEREGRWVGRLRRINTAKLHHWGIPGLADDAESVISELAANALLHGKGDRVGFRLLLTADVLAIEVDDGSPGRAHVNEADPYDESGRGLFIVSALSRPVRREPRRNQDLVHPRDPRNRAEDPVTAPAGAWVVLLNVRTTGGTSSWSD